MLSGDLCRIQGIYWVEVDIFNVVCTRVTPVGGPCIWLAEVDVVSSKGTVVPCGLIMKPDGSVVRIPVESLRACLKLVIFSPRSVWIQRSTR